MSCCLYAVIEFLATAIAIVAVVITWVVGFFDFLFG